MQTIIKIKQLGIEVNLSPHFNSHRHKVTFDLQILNDLMFAIHVEQ